MENASKALLIAGSILLSLIIISLVLVMYNNVQQMQLAQSRRIEQQQLLAFNREYEAYNKSLLYGTDVITVVNKAINNNKKMNIETEKDNRYYVNVIINIRTECKGYKEERTIDGEPEVTPNSGEATIGTGTNEKYELGTGSMNETIINFFNQSANETIETAGNITTITTPALVQFKKLIFTCENIKYNENGRVNEIIFTECIEKTDP